MSGRYKELKKLPDEERMKIVRGYLKNRDFNDFDEYCLSHENLRKYAEDPKKERKNLQIQSDKQPIAITEQHKRTRNDIEVQAVQSDQFESSLSLGSKMQKRNTKRTCLEGQPHKKSKIVGLHSGSISNPRPAQDLPTIFKRMVEEQGGSELKLVIQKRLTTTDLNPMENRLSMPLCQIREEFLRIEEITHLSSHQRQKNMRLPEIKVDIIQPSGNICKVTLKRYDMRKTDKTGSSYDPAKTSSMYVFNGEWKEIQRRNQLEDGMMVQVWSYRKPDDKLCFVLVKLEAEVE
ncbi:hypothetical protein NMG60_11002125 [Bertholletia excelsa]